MRMFVIVVYIMIIYNTVYIYSYSGVSVVCGVVPATHSKNILDTITDYDNMITIIAVGTILYCVEQKNYV